MESYYPNTHAIWNKLADAYQEKFMHLAMYNSSYDLFCETLPTRQPKVLEIGCGPGNIAQYLLQKSPNMHLLGTDVAPTMVELAQKNVPNAQFKTLDCRDIATINSTFDGVICGFCIPYLTPTDCQKLIADCGLLLRANGVFYLSFVAGEKHLSGEKTNSRGEKMHFEYYTQLQLEQWLQENGFSRIQVLKVPFTINGDFIEEHTILIAVKSV